MNGQGDMVEETGLELLVKVSCYVILAASICNQMLW